MQKVEKTIHLVQEVITKLCRVFMKKKYILLYAEFSYIEEHAIDFIEIINKLDYVIFYYPKYQLSEEMLHYLKKNHVKLRKNFASIIFIPWSLIVCPDKRPRYRMNVPYLYINHGTHIVGRNNGEDTYAYYDLGMTRSGEVSYSRIFEPNKRIAQYILDNKPKYDGKVVWTGWKYAEQLEMEKRNYDTYRQTFKIHQNEVVVFIVGTWGKDSIFHSLGDELLRNVIMLDGKKYRFMLSIHPKEYSTYGDDIKPLGQRIDQLRNKGIIVRDPSEDWMRYLVAADIVVSDYSTLTEMAIMLGKKIIFSEFPESTIWKQSSIAKAKVLCETLRRGDDLKEVLDRVNLKEVSKEMCKLSEDTYVSRKDYESIVKRTVKDLVEGE